MVPLMRAFYRSDYARICGIMGSQMGKTDSCCNVLGHRIDTDPVPVMYIAPTKEFVQKTWEPRFTAMVNGTASLLAKVSGGRQAVTQKTIAGIRATFGWSGSASSLSGETACIVLVDERDRMDDDVEGEGDPVELADGRHATYADGKTGIFSTPLIGNVETEVHPETGLEHWKVADDIDVMSPTWRIWQEGTRHEWMWPCPDCGEYFAPRFSLLTWPKDEEGKSLEPGKIKAKHVGVICFHCGSIIDEKHKEWMNANGRAVAPGQWVDEKGIVQGAAPFSLTYSLWVSGLASPWRNWHRMCLRWLAAVRSGEGTKIQGVLNIQFGQLYSASSEAPDWELVAAKRTGYEMGELAVADPLAIVMGVDVQLDRLVYIIRAYYHGMESRLIEHGEIYSDFTGTDADDVWDALASFKDLVYGGRSIDRCFVDSRYRTPYVFKFCRKHKRWAYPIVGVEEQPKPMVMTKVDVTTSGKIQKGGLSRWRLHTDYFKRWIHDRIERDPDLDGQWYLPQDATDDYCKQIVAEARVVKPSGKIAWVKVRKDNHYLDCEMMGLACAHSLKVHIKAELPPAPSNVERGGRAPAAPARRDGSVGIRRSPGGSGSNWFRR